MALSSLNKALVAIPKRAETREGPQLHDSFIDSGIGDVLDTHDHQVLYGRRGTGKTHALSYLAAEASSRGDISLQLDLRSIGSPDGLIDAQSASPAQRAARLLVDLLRTFHEALVDEVVMIEELIDNDAFVSKTEDLLDAISAVRVDGDVEETQEDFDAVTDRRSGSINVRLAPKPEIGGGAARGRDTEDRTTTRQTRRGVERTSPKFSEVSRALRTLSTALGGRRIWLLLDEWSSVPRDLQPYLAEFVVRSILPLNGFTVKIAAIEQQTNFRTTVGENQIGIELGADMGAHINLDDFLVYEGNEERSRDFFRRLFHKHVLSVAESRGLELPPMAAPTDVIRVGFTERRAFDELVRAAEGVPRDAIYIAAKAASRAGESTLSVPVIRDAAQSWYQTDKSSAVRSRDNAGRLLDWIITNVIKEKRARAFLVNQRAAQDELLLALFDARVLHIVRRGYSAQDNPGERYDVWGIDYGAYVDLLQTRFAPVGALAVKEDDHAGIDVPMQDLRAIRRAILDLAEFYEDQGGAGTAPPR